MYADPPTGVDVAEAAVVLAAAPVPAGAS